MKTKTKTDSPQDPDPDEVIRKCTAILSEHFDAVQVLVSNFDSNGTTSMSQRGSGNYYARVQMCQTYVDRHKAEHIADFIVKGMQD